VLIAIALAVVVVAAVLALFSAHIPGLRRLTGAAPLISQESDDFARTFRDGNMETPDQFAARVGLDSTETPGEGS
jgi:hypothetical protein